jgi:hypothetical protein
MRIKERRKDLSPLQSLGSYPEDPERKINPPVGFMKTVAISNKKTYPFMSIPYSDQSPILFIYSIFITWV